MYNYVYKNQEEKLDALEMSICRNGHPAVNYSYAYWGDHIIESHLNNEIVMELDLFPSNQYRSLLIWNADGETLLELITPLRVSTSRKQL